MKAKLILTITLFSVITSFSQTKKSESNINKVNRIGINLGLGTPLSKGSGSIRSKGSVNTVLDYGRAVSDKVELGIEFNQSLNAVKEADATVDVVTVGASSAFLIKGRYFITGNTYEGLYGGLGIGLGRTGYAMKISGTVYSGATKTNFAFTPELGYRYKWFNASVKYINIGGQMKDDLGNGVTLKTKLENYQDLQFAIGVNIPF